MFSDLFWAIYLIDVLGNASGGLALFVGMVLVVLFIITLHDYECKRDDKWGYRKPMWRIVPFVALIIIIGCLLPSKNTMYMMLGIKTTENVVESPLGKKIQDIINAEVDGYLNNIKKEK